MDSGKPEITSVKITGLGGDVWTWHLTNMKQKRYSLEIEDLLFVDVYMDKGGTR
jgi:hypothetical protein